ncbi:MAG: bifunctional UDP-N-acetylglucosamine diphosphorylase/glucosamine-1-phosphate N-acetyltransferase GlmU [Gammaproteobacteria bacterium]
MSLNVIILAAGAGTRMRSKLPKVLHEVGGKPMLEHVVDAARQLDARRIQVVYGHGGEAVRSALAHLEVVWVEQGEQLGTGHAVAQTLPHMGAGDTVLVLYGDVPLISAETLRQVVAVAQQDSLGLLTVRLDDPRGYGRIVRDDQGSVVRIVEEKDASTEQRAIAEINTGMLAVSGERLQKWLAVLDNNNAQGEYYLTDIIAMAVRDGVKVSTVAPRSAAEVMGVNNRVQLAEVERHYQRAQAEHLMLAGITLRDPTRFDVRGELSAGSDVTIDVNVVIEGKVVLGNGVRIGPNVVLRNAAIGDDVEILAQCVIEDAVIGAHCRIGPFARIRPETRLAADVHIGNFVEIKKSEIGQGSKINHLSYVGDATVGGNVNIGAGTITCNYDGANKHRTIIGNDVFVGSSTQLVAPVTVGDGATIGAGSTITRDAPPGELTLSRTPQQTRLGWKRPIKKK